jgi:hypothetical protein
LRWVQPAYARGPGLPAIGRPDLDDRAILALLAWCRVAPAIDADRMEMSACATF